MKITTEIISAAKQIPIIEVARERIHVIHKNGRNVALCISPNHNDTHPSMYINDVDKGNYCHCFSCQENWDTIQFIRDTDNVDFQKAVEILYQMFPQYFAGINIENPEKSSYWKGLNYKELEYLGIPANYVFKNGEETDEISVKNIALNQLPLWIDIVSTHIEQKKQLLKKIEIVAKQRGLNYIPDEHLETQKTYEEHVEYMNKLLEKAHKTY